MSQRVGSKPTHPPTSQRTAFVGPSRHSPIRSPMRAACSPSMFTSGQSARGRAAFSRHLRPMPLPPPNACRRCRRLLPAAAAILLRSTATLVQLVHFA